MALARSALPLVAAAALFLAACAAPAAEAPEPQRAGMRSADVFPTASAPLELDAVSAESGTLLELVSRLAEIGGLHLVAAAETRAILERKPIGLAGPVVIPPREVWPFAQGLLAAASCALIELPTAGQRLVQVVSLDASERNAVRGGALLVPVERIADYAACPALLVSTIVELPQTDVRMLANSMRTILFDANIQQIVPLGDSSFLVLTGFASWIAALVPQLREVDAAGRAAEEGGEAARP